MTELIIQAELFPKDFCMFDMIVEQFDSNTLSMSHSLVIISALSLNKNCQTLFSLSFLAF